ncbi:DNA-3-methyladenine glycosylase I [candidate division KSB1 bacterium]
MKKRCGWPGSDPMYIDYHDNEWGVPVHDDRKIFEFLILEGFQAGLSWSTILKKRDNFRKAFDDFDYNKVADYDEKKIEELMNNAGIIRNRAKINASISNAKAFIETQKEFGSFDKYIWGLIGGKQIVNKWKTIQDLPAMTKESDLISADLKKRGFKFVGSTIIYAHMQAAGMVNDHIVSCYRYKEVIDV